MAGRQLPSQGSSVRDRERLSRTHYLRLFEYRFHTGTWRHPFCGTCGIYPSHRMRVTPDCFGANIFCLADFEPDGIPLKAMMGKGMN